MTFLLVGCGSSELTRERAKVVLEKSEVYKEGPKTVQISTQEVNALTRSGYLAWGGFAPRKLEPTPEDLSIGISGAIG